MIPIHENYEGYVPRATIRKSVTRLLEGLPPAAVRGMFVFPTLMFGLTLVHHFIGRGASDRKRWARIASMCIAALMVFAVPLGTIIAIYLFANRDWSPVLPDEGKAVQAT